MDLTTPTDHAGAYEWAAVLLAHGLIGLALVAIVAALMDATDMINDAGRTAWVAVALGYALMWEGAVQRLGAGLGDAAVDSAAVALGGALGLLAWHRNGMGIAVTMTMFAAFAWNGIRRRK